MTDSREAILFLVFISQLYIAAANGHVASTTYPPSGEHSDSYGTPYPSGEHSDSYGTPDPSGEYSHSYGTPDPSGEYSYSYGTSDPSGEHSYSYGTPDPSGNYGTAAYPHYGHVEGDSKWCWVEKEYSHYGGVREKVKEYHAVGEDKLLDGECPCISTETQCEIYHDQAKAWTGGCNLGLDNCTCPSSAPVRCDVTMQPSGKRKMLEDVVGPSKVIECRPEGYNCAEPNGIPRDGCVAISDSHFPCEIKSFYTSGKVRDSHYECSDTTTNGVCCHEVFENTCSINLTAGSTDTYRGYVRWCTRNETKTENEASETKTESTMSKTNEDSWCRDSDDGYISRTTQSTYTSCAELSQFCTDDSVLLQSGYPAGWLHQEACPATCNSCGDCEDKHESYIHNITEGTVLSCSHLSLFCENMDALVSEGMPEAWLHRSCPQTCGVCPGNSSADTCPPYMWTDWGVKLAKIMTGMHAVLGSPTVGSPTTELQTYFLMQLRDEDIEMMVKCPGKEKEPACGDIKSNPCTGQTPFWCEMQDQDGNDICVASGRDCPCPSGLARCWDNSCAVPCPCRANEYLCNSLAYPDPTAEHTDYMAMHMPTSVTPTCVTSMSECTCGNFTVGPCEEERFETYGMVKVLECLPSMGWLTQCPVKCGPGQKKCESYDADAMSYNEFCVNNTETCPCPGASMGEKRCNPTDTYCSYWCPCEAPKKFCQAWVYDDEGYPQDMTETCVASAEECTCGDTSLSTACPVYDWFECLPKSQYTQCPLSCAMDEMPCYDQTYTYTADGEYNMSYYPTEIVSCASQSDGCPCDPTWETKCSSSWGSYCTMKTYGCPLDCGDKRTCYGYEYYANGSMVETLDPSGFTYPKTVETCGTGDWSTTCPCDSTHENACTDEWGYSYCMPKIYAPSCPTVCTDATPIKCYRDGYDSEGMWSMQLMEELCTATQEECDATCGTGAVKCSWEYGSYCQAATVSCPISCEDPTPHTCYVSNYDNNGDWLDMTESCSKSEENCPCGTGQNPEKCTWTWDEPDGTTVTSSYCIPANEKCPLTCTGNQQHCWITDYQSDSDNFAAEREECVDKGLSCPCGTNAEKCKFFDSYLGKNDSYCIPSYYGCPKVCTPEQELRFVVDYTQKGEFLRHKENCVPKGAPVVCGLNSHKCQFPDYGLDGEVKTIFMCFPFWDNEENIKLECPVFCDPKKNEEYCSVPNFDASGMATSFVEQCAKNGAPCDCAKGNGKECTRYGFRECIPKAEVCPTQCSAGKVDCYSKPNFDKDGLQLKDTILGDAEKCKDSYDKCPCGLNSKMCKMGDGFGYCIPQGDVCPVICNADQQLCYVDNYATDGSVSSSSTLCVLANATCPCGKNGKMCKVDGVQSCMSRQMATTLCPCKSGEDVKLIKDFNLEGGVVGTRSTCLKSGAKATCGGNATSCTNSDGVVECIPMFTAAGLARSCPKECTAVAETTGKRTCSTKTLMKNGKVSSVSTRCVKESDCKPGGGFKKCDFGSVILTGAKCVDIYGLRQNTTSRRLAATDASKTFSMMQDMKTETAVLKFTMTGVTKTGKAKADGAERMQTELETVLQLDSKVKTDLTLTDGGNGDILVIFQVTNPAYSKNAPNIKPRTVVEKLKNNINSNDAGTKAAMKRLGGTVKKINGKCTPCSISFSEKSKFSKKDLQTYSSANLAPTKAPTSAPANAPAKAPTKAPVSSPTPAPTSAPTSAPTALPAKAISGRFSLSGMTAAAAATFAANDKAKKAVKDTIASITGIAASHIDVSMAVARRLKGLGRRLLTRSVTMAGARRLNAHAGSVTVSYKMTVPADGSQTSVSRAGAVRTQLTSAGTSGTFQTKLREECAKQNVAGANSLTVANVQANVVDSSALLASCASYTCASPKPNRKSGPPTCSGLSTTSCNMDTCCEAAAAVDTTNTQTGTASSTTRSTTTTLADLIRKSTTSGVAAAILSFFVIALV